MRTPLVVGNWKMNPTSMEAAIELAGGVRAGAEGLTDAIAVVCPPAIWLRAVADSLDGGPVKIGAQTMHAEEGGAFTGEISPLMLAGLAEYVIIGHSERRQEACETDDTVAAKVASAVRHGLRPIMAIGERADERAAGATEAVIDRQLRIGLSRVDRLSGSRLVIAYEPVWAIGTGRNATDAQAQEVHAFIRELIGKRWNKGCGDRVRIQYGGSMKPENAAGLMAQPDVDGGLIGGAALNAESFLAIVNSAI